MNEREHAKRVRDALHAMNEAYVSCRDYGHAWRPYTASWHAKERAYYTQARCERCGCLRARWLDRHGAQVSNAYTYPDGYLVSGLGRLTGADRDALRLESVLHVLAHEREETG